MRNITTLTLAICPMLAMAQFTVDYEGGLTANAGSGDFAPYFMASNNHGTLTQPFDVQLRAKAWREMTLDKRFNYGFGVDVIGGYASATDYMKYDNATSTWSQNPMRPATAWIQQLYGEVKFRGVFLTVGLKEYKNSGIVDQELSSGDLVFSGNTRPIPGFRAGFVDFQNIPFTQGWVQIGGELGYAKSTDNAWTRDHFNRFNGRLNQGWWYNYKRCYFRTNPAQPFSVTVGMQAAAQFGGDVATYMNGAETSYKKRKVDIGTFFKVFIPQGGEEFYTGNHVGSWDFKGRYRLNNGDEIAAYFEWPWEDGSGIGKLNGFDGLWGLSYHRKDGRWLRGVVVEYLDFTNQSGPIHWDPVDAPGTTITSQATGYDNYYNNFMSNGYSIYGMSIGSPFLPSPLYNLNGVNGFECTRVRGFHVGVNGGLTSRLDYRFLLSYRRGWGTFQQPYLEPRDDTSMLIECGYHFKAVSGLTLKGSVAFDSGSLYGNNFGALVTCSYHGLFNIGKK